MVRYCNGGPDAETFCGEPASVVCTEVSGHPWPLQWYACDDIEHHGRGKVEPIGEWLERNGLGSEEDES